MSTLCRPTKARWNIQYCCNLHALIVHRFTGRTSPMARFIRCLFHRYTRRTLVVLLVTWCIIFVATAVFLYPHGQRRSRINAFMDTKWFEGGQNATDVAAVLITGVSGGPGGLNVHLWRTPGFEVKSLKAIPFFPCFPVVVGYAASFAVEVSEGDTGQRVFGFLTPPVTGKYQFAITSDDGSELWLSTNSDPRNARLIAGVHDSENLAWTKPGEVTKYRGQISDEINLTNGQKYFVESLHKNGVGLGHVQVLWRIPGGSEQFNLISGPYLSPFCTEDNVSCVCENGKSLQNTPSHLVKFSQLWEKQFQYYFNMSFLGADDVAHDVLPVSPYDPSYVVKDGFVEENLGIYISLDHQTAVYPKDGTEIQRGRSFLNSDREFKPNSVLPREEVEGVVRKFIDALEQRFARRFTVEDVVAVEGKSDRQGTRYLLELKLHDAQENRNLRFAEYVFQSNSSALSLAGGLAWNRRAVVNFIVPIKNQAKWMSFLVSELTDLYLRTGDEKFHLVVVDFESNDGDVASILQRSPLSQKCTLIKKSGAFHKTMAIQEAVESVTDVNSIVFLFDLHITLPRIFLDTIRKHTIQGKMAFLPIVARLENGYTPEKPKGRWEELGCGLVAVYKSDWDRFHGMNVEKFKTKWGGEDWNLLDRMLRAGLETERFRMPGLYHYYHSKSHMWDRP